MACVSASCSTFIAWDVRCEVRTGTVGMETGRQEMGDTDKDAGRISGETGSENVLLEYIVLGPR